MGAPPQEITKKELQGNFTEDVALLEFENPKIKVVPKKVTVSLNPKVVVRIYLFTSTKLKVVNCRKAILLNTKKLKVAKVCRPPV